MKRGLFFMLFQLALIISFAQNFTVGQKVEGWNSGEWYKGTITQIGADNYKGYYYVQWDKYTVGQWVKASNIRTLKNETNTAAVSPRNGRYIILSYGNPTNPVRIGYFDLNNGQYTYYNLAKKQIGQGSYSYDSKSKMISWKTGPFKDAKWNGAFEVDREGKTHKIRLNSATIGSNSTDSN
ncbi:MAG TPA: hypothetical protein VNS32_05510 [Flavisolibacter sp.]|nr:hypothetical protein [Flavisolibacter sp.]